VAEPGKHMADVSSQPWSMETGDDGGLAVELSHVSVFFLLLMWCPRIAGGHAGTEGPVDVH
jgi:hypothetical protein